MKNQENLLKLKRMEKELAKKDEEKERAVQAVKEENKKALAAEKEEKRNILKTVESSLRVLGKRAQPNSQGSVKISASKAGEVVK